MGLTQDELLDNADIQRLLVEQHDKQINLDSRFEQPADKTGGKKAAVHKISNLQILLKEAAEAGQVLNQNN